MKEFTEYRSDQFHTIIYKKSKPEDVLAAKFGERYVEYRKKWERASRCELVQEYPLHLNFELFYGCNLRCPMCVYSIPASQRNYKVEPEKRVPFEKYREIIEEGVRHGLCAVQLSGLNEPLLQRDLIKHIDYAAGAGIIDIFIITNATLLTPEISKGLLESGLTQIKFSIDSASKETYEKIRVGANFEKTINGINTFLELKKKMRKTLPITRVSFIKTKENISEVDDFVAYWADRVDYITIQNLANPFLGSEKYEEFEDSFRTEGATLAECPMPYQRMFIRNNGDILPCCSSYGYEIPVGNIYENMIYEIWNSELMKQLRKSINGPSGRQPLPCRKCRQAIAHQTGKL